MMVSHHRLGLHMLSSKINKCGQKFNCKHSFQQPIGLILNHMFFSLYSQQRVHFRDNLHV